MESHEKKCLNFFVLVFSRPSVRFSVQSLNVKFDTANCKVEITQ